MTARPDSEEERRRDRATRFRQAVESGPIGIGFWDADGTLYDANDSFLAITGYTRASILAGTVKWSVITTDLREADTAPMLEQEFLRPDGVRIPLLIRHARLGTGPVHGVSYVLDLREQKRSVERSRRADKTQAVVRLAGGVAHDFNNLLMTILGNSEMLTARLDAKGPLHEMATLIKDAAQRAAQLTRRLLAAARGQPLRPQAVDVDRIAIGLMERLRPSLGDGIAVEFARAGELRQAIADPAALETALLNLIDNARDAMPDGGRLLIETGVVQVGTAPAQQPGDVRPGPYVTVSITDNGTGMAPEAARWAFDPFFSTKRGGSGRGLGLSMVEGFAQQSGGDVVLASVPGKGTTVTIYLPAAPAGTA